MGLEHEFYCIPETNRYQRQYWEARKKYPEALVHDDVMRYINDTLIWIPCLHISGSKQKKTHGLSLYGITLIDQEGAAILGSIVDGWKGVFANGPSNFELTGNLKVKRDGQVYDPMEWRKIPVDRDILIENLTKIKAFTEQVMNDENLVIFHFGI